MNVMEYGRDGVKLVDTRTPEQRRHIMQSVKTKNTGPEMIVRRLLHSLGFRYRLHAKELPGKPDMVFPSRRKAIFIHGCYWHGHSCAKGRLPKSRLDYWGPKIERNKSRDVSNIGKLTREGWTSMVVWQCQIKNIEALQKRLVTFLNRKSS